MRNDELLIKKRIVFVIGVPKAGTTTLASLLRQHPDILVSNPKETLFHIRDYSKGVNYFLNQYFDLNSKANLFCEMSISNMYFSESTAQIIHNDFPNAKLIALLRNPIYRAFSDYRDNVRKGNENLSFENTFLTEEKRIKFDKYYSFDTRIYFRKGLYYEQLQRFLRYFDKEQIRIYQYEEFYENIKFYLNDIFSFIGVSKLENININIKKNVGKYEPRSKLFHFLINGQYPLKISTKKIIPKSIYRRLGKYIAEINLKEYNKKEISPDFIKILNNYYKEDVKKLEKEFNRTFQKWNIP